MTFDVRAVVDRLSAIESIALLPRTSSTNAIARRVVAECLENEIPLPSAIIVAREQIAGRGREGRSWVSPAGGGIYASLLHTRAASALALLPLEAAAIVATYLRDVWNVDARIKWPNDIVVNGRKIAGILIEARSRDNEAFVILGVGINVRPVGDPSVPNATSIAEASSRENIDLDDATVAFIEFLDEKVAVPLESEALLERWRSLAIHRPGDRIQSVVGNRAIEGTWIGIDDSGRALLRHGGEEIAVAAGELMFAD